MYIERSFRTVIRLVFIATIGTILLFKLNINKKDSTPNQQFSTNTACKTPTTVKSFISTNETKLASFLSFMNRHRCRIEVFGGFEGLEQAYISGTLFRYIPETCSCYLHYQPIDKFSRTEHEPVEAISEKSSNIARIVWCVLGCPKDVIKWCRDVQHRLYCQKYVVLFDLFDEYANSPSEHYSYMAAVYRNYLRHDSGNYLTYLTRDLRRLLKRNDLQYIHTIFNWTFAIHVMKEEWQNVGFDASNHLTTPSFDVLNQLNHRITARLLKNHASITYHTWPNLDIEIRKSRSKKLPVFWFPIGYTPTYLYDAVQSSVGPTSQRRRLWTWMGSVKEDERTDMIKRFELNDTLANYIRNHGFLLITGSSNGGIINMGYTSELLDSRFIPLPRGYSPEQYRSYEALESGTLPIVNENWLKIKENVVLEPLAYLNILGYDPPTLNNFTKLPEKLLELSRLPLDLLDHWQGIMLVRHKIIMQTLAKHIATVICATTSTQGYIHQEDQDIE